MTDWWNSLALATGYILAGLSLFLGVVLVLLIVTGLEVTRPQKPEVKGSSAKRNERGKL